MLSRSSLIRCLIGGATLSLGLLCSGHARAQAPEPTQTTPTAAPRPADLGFTREDAARAHFSGGRYVVELLVSGAGGSLASYGTFKAVCGSSPCMGGAFAGAGVNVVATPLLTMGTGALMGGHGGFLMTALFGVLGFTATAPLASSSPNAALVVSLALMPVLAPLGYEISSNMRATEMDRALLHVGNLTPIIQPLRFENRTVGTLVGVSGTL